MIVVVKGAHHRLGHLNLTGTVFVVGMRLGDEAVGSKDFLHSGGSRRALQLSLRLLCWSKLLLKLDDYIKKTNFCVCSEFYIFVLIDLLEQPKFVQSAYAL